MIKTKYGTKVKVIGGDLKSGEVQVEVLSGQCIGRILILSIDELESTRENEIETAILNTQ
jgi:hypothetical protein